MKKSIKSIFLVITAGLFLTSCSLINKTGSAKTPEIRNVILMIGDGMGVDAVYAAMSVSKLPLNMEKCPVTGFQKTYSENRYITDSGASGTAIATGKKTNNGAIGVDPAGNRLRSVLEIAEENGLATGLVSTSAVTHATPASFIAHQANRNNYEDIAADFLKTDIDVFIGGGYDHFAKRADNLNLIDSLKARGYAVETSMNSIIGSTSPKLAGLIAPEHSPYRLNGRGEMLSLATRKAIDLLKEDRDGFFLMVEGSQIDWAAHAHHADTLVSEVLDFDQAAGVALDFAKTDGHTLVIITADHETGGVTIIGGNNKIQSVRLSFSTTEHSAVMVPVFSYGPGSDKFSGVYDNTDIFHKIIGLYDFPTEK
ncbi:MAG: alkaline phosphatase [Bacteroidales bacterium]|nr:alkaline phosphatase [Bacteroidales bacterium]